MKDIFVLVYTSKFASNLNFKDIQDILKISRELNLRDEITGLLVARDGYFLQLIEGSEEKVRACYARICKDRRHLDITLQGQTFTEKRMFPEWSMGLVDASDLSGASVDILTLFELGRKRETYEEVESLMTILKIFSNKAKII